jgi:hypothetical protein
VELQILPPRYRNRGYGCWTRVIVGFCADWEYPTRPVDRAKSSYRGWPAPVVAPVVNSGVIPPQFREVSSFSGSFNRDLLRLASSLVQGHALFCARIDTSGAVAEWFKARNVDEGAIRTDFEYLSYTSALLGEAPPEELRSMNFTDRARLSAEELESIMPYLLFAPARNAAGDKIDMWVLVTPAIFR